MKRPSSVSCPSCASTNVAVIGSLPDSARFAGNVLPAPLPGGELMRCDRCALWFRHPALPAEKLRQLYERGEEHAWSVATAVRPDWDAIRAQLQRLAPSGRVLDIGCFDGTLLASLGAGYECHGVEINPVAAQRARRRGITLVGKTLDQVLHSAEQFDIVIATDVIEHMSDPRGFLAGCRRLTCPGGITLISTGCTDAWSWRLMGAHYWYCANAEHLSFLGESWVRQAAEVLRMELLAIERFAHDRSPGRAVAQFIMNLGFRLVPDGVAALRRRFARDALTRTREDLCRLPPSWSTARDHMLFALRTVP